MKTILDYTITKEDLLGATPNKLITTILQTKYFKWEEGPIDATLYAIRKEFKQVFAQLKKEYSAKKITIEEFNTEIYKQRIRLMLTYPKYFPESNELGYYQTKTLVSLWTKGALLIEGNSYNEYLKEIEKQKEQVAAEKETAKREQEQKTRIQMFTEFLIEKHTVCIEAGKIYTTEELKQAYKYLVVKNVSKEIKGVLESAVVTRVLQQKHEVLEVLKPSKPIPKRIPCIVKYGSKRKIDILSDAPEAVEWRNGKTVEQLLIEYNFF